MTIAAAFGPITDASISIASAYRPIAAVKIRDIDIELCESTLLTVVHLYL